MADFDEGFIEEKEFDIEKIGSYGSFSTSNSYPIEYVLTTFRAKELAEKLCFAKDVRPENIDFDLLMQRDIDEERVRAKIAPYLDPDLKDEKDGVSPLKKAIFFPPLLVAVVPVSEKKMSTYYENEISTDEGERYLARRWGSQFQLTYAKTKSSISSRISTFLSDGSTGEFLVSNGSVKFECRKAVGQMSGVKLIVIDGQHRLKALQEVAERSPEKIANLSVPVCLLYAPLSQERLSGENLTIPEVFRQLFVDVNSTAEPVGGHFQILLSDSNIGSLICRQFCASLLTSGDDGQIRLAAVEWNTKSLKESTNVVKKYSITSIGVIEKALRESFRDRSSELHWWLSLKSIEDQLYPAELERGSIECPEVDWNTFSAFQRVVLIDQIRQYAVPTLQLIFFESGPYQEAFAFFKEEMKCLHAKLDDSREALARYYPAYEQIVEYVQIPDEQTKEHRRARLEVKEISDRVYERIQDSGLELIRYALFQRAAISLWMDFLQFSQIHGCNPIIAAKMVSILLGVAFSKENREVFSSRKYYMQHSVYRGSSIITIEETKKALKNLLGSFLLQEEVVDSLFSLVENEVKSPEHFIEQLKDYGYDCPSAFIGSFERGFKKIFRKTYAVSDSLTADEKDRITKAEQISRLHRKEYREKKRTKEDISQEFEDLIDSYTLQASARAKSELRSHLALDLDILGDRDSADEEQDSL